MLPVVGRVSMDTVTADATDVPADRLVPGAPVDVIDDVHDINALAEQAGTTPTKSSPASGRATGGEI